MEVTIDEHTGQVASAEEFDDECSVPDTAQRRKRRTICLVIFLIAMIGIVVGVVMRPRAASSGGVSSATGTDNQGNNNAPQRSPFAPQSASQQNTQTIFCVIADTPYNADQRIEMKGQLNNIAPDCEFLVHLGDIKPGNTSCVEYVYSDARSILLRSHAPTFIIVGDNEFNDCPYYQIQSGMGYWNKYLLYLGNEWNHGFTIVRHNSRPENFYFVHKRTLFLFLNIVGGRVIDDWDERHADLVDFTIEAISRRVPRRANGIVIMAHAHPYAKHDTYFDPVTRFIEQSSFLNNIPILYIHGDGHAWERVEGYRGLDNMLRIQTYGGTGQMPLKMIVDPYNKGMDLSATFLYDRNYDDSDAWSYGQIN
jgi:predicted nucleic acid-binding Zn ribbon protein